MPQVSVVVLNWNGAHLLPVCLDSVRAQTFRDFEVIMPDNGSTDGSVELVRERYPEVRVLPFSENLGFCLAVNAGIRASRGEFIALLNNDTELDRNYVNELVGAMQADGRLGICAPKMVYYDDPAHQLGGTCVRSGWGGRGHRSRAAGRRLVQPPARGAGRVRWGGPVSPTHAGRYRPVRSRFLH